jgi:hypothetical protein
MEVEELTERLVEPELKQIATMRLERYTVREIARRIRHGGATIIRKLRQIREIWRESGLAC